MNYYYITGTSRGIGKALAELLLEKDTNKVIGISRNCTIQHKNYIHLNTDLSNSAMADTVKFINHSDAEQMVLVNNAGAITETKYLGNLDSGTIISDYIINLVSPAVLINNFIKTYKDNSAEKIIINISSGAGKSPVDGWGVYCSSKSGLDMLSLVIADEQQRQAEGFSIFSIAPGVVDTAMQDAIRETDQENFSRVAEFIAYKKEHVLTYPILVAKKLVSILVNVRNTNKTIFSLKE